MKFLEVNKEAPEQATSQSQPMRHRLAQHHSCKYVQIGHQISAPATKTRQYDELTIKSKRCHQPTANPIILVQSSNMIFTSLWALITLVLVYPGPSNCQQPQLQQQQISNGRYLASSAFQVAPSSSGGQFNHRLPHSDGQLQRPQLQFFNDNLDSDAERQQQPVPHASPLVSGSVGASGPSMAASNLAPTSGQKSLIRTVNPGDRVNIPCALANMGGSIQFAKDDQPIILDSGCAHCQLDISNDGQASLTINRVSMRDQGNWQCWRLDAQGKVKQKIAIIQLVVTNSPELPILIVNDKELLAGNNLDATITIKENEIVNFKCVIKGAATPVDYVHWILDSSTNVTQMSQLMMEYSAQENNYLTQSVLKLNATKSMNLKSISCLSNHHLWLTPMTVTALLNVLYEPSFTISREPAFGVTVSEGMTVILKCEIDSNPISSPIWIRDAANKTTSTAASSSTSGQPDQQDQQQQQQQQFNGKEMGAGEPIVLDTQEDGSVVFQPAKSTDSGWYRCKTENKYGNFSSFGYYLHVRPAATSLPQSAGSASASQSQLLSNYISNSQSPSQGQNQRPRSDSRIMSPNQPAAQVMSGPNFFASSSNYRQRPLQQQQQQQQQLEFNSMPNQTPPHALANDEPAIHSQQQQQQQPLADERCKSPSGVPDIANSISTVQAVLGRQLILPLRFCCQPGPARVFWIHRHLAMIPGRMFGPYITRDLYSSYNKANCYETTFEIESVKPEDIGTVYVFVSNERGHAGAQIHIQLAKSAPLSSQTPTPTTLGGFSATSLGPARFPLLHGMGSSAAAPTMAPGGWLLPLLIIAALATAASCNTHSIASFSPDYLHHFAPTTTTATSTNRDGQSARQNTPVSSAAQTIENNSVRRDSSKKLFHRARSQESKKDGWNSSGSSQ